jgi:hypothetical protein
MRRRPLFSVVLLIAGKRLVAAAGQKEGAANRSENKCEFHIWNLMVGRFREAVGEIVTLFNFGFGRTRVSRRVLVRIGAPREESQNKQCEHRFHGSEVYPASSIAPASIKAADSNEIAARQHSACPYSALVIKI